MTIRCDTCKRPVDDSGRVTRRYILGSRRPGRVIAATCSDCRPRPSIERATDRLAHDVGRIYDVLP